MKFEIIDAHVHPFFPWCGKNIGRFGIPENTDQFLNELRQAGVSMCCGSFIEVFKTLDFETLEKIATCFSVNMNTLLGKEDAFSKEKNSIVGIKIPVLGKVAAGIPITAVENILDYEEISSEMASSGDYVALKIQGSSMEPRMYDGDVVIVRVQSTVEHGEVAVVMVDGSEATVKKVQFLSNGILLQPFNPSYEPIFYSKEDVENFPVRIFGKVVECRQKY